MLNFVENAIELSGETGTKLKCEILRRYYPLWWYITSGGPQNLHAYPTTFVEMNAGSGENYIKETNETILGSSGHTLATKYEHQGSPLKVILVENDKECFSHLKKVISKRWPDLTWSENIDDIQRDVYLLNTDTTDAIKQIQKIELGKSLFFFDPLLYTPWNEIEKVAKQHITKYYQTGTEFILFLFSSDWFYGRGEMAPLPDTNDISKWDEKQKKTVEQVDDLFGHKFWRDALLTPNSIDQKIETIVNLYRKNLHTWFRYVLPFPFTPKLSQTYHLFMCSNYEEGINIPKKFYTKYTGNHPFAPDYNRAFLKFRIAHQIPYFKKSTRPLIWRILWRIIKDHEEGICDVNCIDLKRLEQDYLIRKTTLEWLEEQGYLEKIDFFNTFWRYRPDTFQLDLKIVKKNLDIDPPPRFKPIERIIKDVETKPVTLDDFIPKGNTEN